MVREHCNVSPDKTISAQDFPWRYSKLVKSLGGASSSSSSLLRHSFMFNTNPTSYPLDYSEKLYAPLFKEFCRIFFKNNRDSYPAVFFCVFSNQRKGADNR